MADQTPQILSPIDSETPSPRRVEEEKHRPPPSSSLDEAIERCLGEFGWAQFIQAALVSLAWVFDAQQTFVSVFTDAEPTWHSSTSTTTISINSSSSSANNDDIYRICQLPRNSWAWDMPIDTSIISEWSLECAGSLITGLPASSFFIGCVAGGLILATLADSSSLGRKNMQLLCCLLMSIAGLFTALSTNIWIYSALRFVCGFGRAAIGTCALVLSTELVGKRWRGQVGIMSFFFFALGFLSLPAIAYLNRGSSWRLIYLWTCVPAIFYCFLLHFLVRESPRWLFVRGRKQEFLATLRSIAPPAKRRGLSLSFIEEIHEESRNDDIVGLYAAIKILLAKRWAWRRLAAVVVVGFGIGMVYYGMPLGVGSLGFNLYVSVTLNALSELPASVVTFLLVGRLKRKGSLLGFTMLSGICSVICSWRGLGLGLQIGLEMVSFFSVFTALIVLLIYTLELFPTCVRNTAMSMVRQALVLGGAFSPVLVAASRNNINDNEAAGKSYLLSYGVFGVTIGFCGLFVIFLPETRGRTLTDTMDEEQEHKFKFKFMGRRGGGGGGAATAAVSNPIPIPIPTPSSSSITH